MANLLTYGLPVIFTVLCVVAFVIYYCKKHCRSKHSQRINKKRRNVDEIWKKRERTSRVFYSLCLLILTPIAFVFWVNAIIVICEKMGSGATIFYSPIGYADSFLSIVGLGSAILIAFFQYRIQCKFEEMIRGLMLLTSASAINYNLPSALPSINHAGCSHPYHFIVGNASGPPCFYSHAIDVTTKELFLCDKRASPKFLIPSEAVTFAPNLIEFDLSCQCEDYGDIDLNDFFAYPAVRLWRKNDRPKISFAVHITGQDASYGNQRSYFVDYWVYFDVSPSDSFGYNKTGGFTLKLSDVQLENVVK